MRTRPLSDGAKTALQSALVTPTSIKLGDQLAPAVYTEVKKALAAIGGGGVWHRRSGLHVFPNDPRPELAALLGTGVIPVSPDDELSYFRTPDDLADLMVDSAFIQHADARVLEPSAGDGRIVRAIYRKHPHLQHVQCVEINKERADYLQVQGFNVVHTSFQRYALDTRDRFDAILMNPPFTTPGDTLAWLTHVELAMTLLRPGGRLVAIVSAAITFRSGPRFEALREAVGDDITVLPRETFKDAGTTFQTAMIEIYSGSGGTPAAAVVSEQLSLFA